MVGLQNDKAALTPLEQAIKGKQKLIELFSNYVIMSKK
jgi:hypothetical protein